MNTSSTPIIYYNLFSNAQNVWFLLYPVVVGFIWFLLWLAFFYKKERRLFRNLKRKVYFLRIDGSTCNLEKEQNLICENGLFKAEKSVRQYSNGLIETIEGKVVLVVSYSPSFLDYANLIVSLKNKKIPVIILAKPREITPEHENIFADYPYLQVCNYTSRLLTSLFDICAVTPL